MEIAAPSAPLRSKLTPELASFQKKFKKYAVRFFGDSKHSRTSATETNIQKVNEFLHQIDAYLQQREEPMWYDYRGGPSSDWRKIRPKEHWTDVDLMACTIDISKRGAGFEEARVLREVLDGVDCSEQVLSSKSPFV